MAMAADHMLTLTYRENKTNALECDADLTRFLRAVRDELGEFLYVAVFERQKRGAGHFHLAVSGWQDVRKLRRIWRRVTGGDGNIHVRSWVGRGRADQAPSKLAGYISKYISKSIDDRVAGMHRYRRSHSIVIQETVEEYDDDDLGRVTAAIFGRVTGSDPAFILRADDGAVNFIWACSWGQRGEGMVGVAGPPRPPSAPSPIG